MGRFKTKFGVKVTGTFFLRKLSLRSSELTGKRVSYKKKSFLGSNANIGFAASFRYIASEAADKLTLKVDLLLEVLLQRLLAVVVLCVFRRHLGFRLGRSC